MMRSQAEDKRFCKLYLENTFIAVGDTYVSFFIIKFSTLKFSDYTKLSDKEEMF